MCGAVPQRRRCDARKGEALDATRSSARRECSSVACAQCVRVVQSYFE